MSFKIGDKVKVSSENDNENYDNFRDKVLIVTDVSKSTDDHQGFDEAMTGQGLYSFEDEAGHDIPCALYDYELEAIV